MKCLLTITEDDFTRVLRRCLRSNYVQSTEAFRLGWEWANREASEIWLGRVRNRLADMVRTGQWYVDGDVIEEFDVLIDGRQFAEFGMEGEYLGDAERDAHYVRCWVRGAMTFYGLVRPFLDPHICTAESEDIFFPRRPSPGS